MTVATPASATPTTSAIGAHAPRLTLSAQNEPIRTVLMRLAKKVGANLAVTDGVSGYVTVELHDVTLLQALRAILEPLGATYRFQQGIFTIESAPTGARTQSATAPAVIPLLVVTAKRAAAMLRPLFPQASFREDPRANALVIVAAPIDLQAIRGVLQGVDIRDPMNPLTEAIALRSGHGALLAEHLRTAFPKARFGVAGDKQLLVTAAPAEMTQIKTAVSALEAPTATPPATVLASEAVPLVRRAPRDIARALAAQVPGLRAAVSGSAVILTGPPDAVSRGKALVVQLDLPNFGERYTQIYRVRTLDASSVADLLRRSFEGLQITVDASLNAIAVVATAAQQQRIADALAQLDAAPQSSQSGGFAQSSGSGNSSTQIVTLKSYIPGQALGGAPDAVASFTQALQVVSPDVRVVQLPTPGQIALLGPAHSVRAARDFIELADVVPPLVVLDTEILEVDETVAKNLGLQFGSAVVSSTFAEMQPQPNADGTPGRLGRFQALSRSPISFTAQLNLLIQNGKGRVLADPRITTLSGRTASIRAGDTISILTTTAGNAGTIATTQVQSFQTGVTLDITPSVTPDGGITVFLHPVVNSLIGTNAGVPEISTRDTQTTVHLRDNETLVIGGLIQESDTRTTTKVPLLGDLPLLGRAFRNVNVQGQRNELIIVVTPHIVRPGANTMPGPPLTTLPTPAPLPTLPPNAQLPAPSGQLPRSLGAPMPAATEVPRARPIASAAVPQPAMSASPPAAFAQTNVFTFGSAPQSNFARPTDPVQIFYATLSPTVVTTGTPIRIAAITTSNATAVKLQVGSQVIVLGRSAPGQWQATSSFPTGAIFQGQTSITASLIASRSDGTSATVPIALNVMAP